MHRLGSKKYKRFNPLFFLLFAVALYLSGCGDGYKSYKEFGGRGAGMLVALVDDSLALVYNVREYELCDESITGTDCIDGGENDGLFLVNYREKSAPLWGDTTEGYLRLARGFYRDSSVFFQDDDGHFGFWRIGGSPRIAGSWINDSCSMANPLEARPWKNGDVLFVNSGSSDCPYAVLDTATGIVSRATFDGADAWLAECDDISYLAGKTMCLKKREGSVCALDLVIDDVLKDSLIMNQYAMSDDPFLNWSYNFVSLNVWTLDQTSPAYLNAADLLVKVNIKTGMLDTTYPELWLNNMSTFSDSVQNEIIYYGDDLIVTGGEE